MHFWFHFSFFCKTFLRTALPGDLLLCMVFQISKRFSFVYSFLQLKKRPKASFWCSLKNFHINATKIILSSTGLCNFLITTILSCRFRKNLLAFSWYWCRSHLLLHMHSVVVYYFKWVFPFYSLSSFHNFWFSFEIRLVLFIFYDLTFD